VKIIVDPVSRIEGHLKVELGVDEASYTVNSAKCTATLFRGFESIVKGRNPDYYHWLSPY